MRPVLLEDFSKLFLLGPPRLRYDGKYLSFRAGRALMDDNSYEYRIWGYDLERGEGPRPLTEGPNDGNPSWEPNGKRFLFVRGVKEGSELLIWSETEEYRVLKHQGIQSVRWASKNLALGVFKEGDKEEDVLTVKRIPFWFNGEGWTYWYVPELRGIDLNTGETWRISPEGLHVRDFAPSPDGKRVAFLAVKDTRKPLEVSLFVSDVYGEDVTELVTGWQLRQVSWGDKVGVVGHDRRRGLATNHHLYVTPPDEWDPVDLSPLDRSLGNSMNSDVRGGIDTRPKWDGKWYFVVHDRMSAHLYVSDGEPKPLVKGDLTVEGFDVRGGKVVISSMRVDDPAEIYEVRGGDLKRLTDFNRGFRERVKLRKPEKFVYRSGEVEIEGFFYRPEGDPPYPTVLYVHGGPATAFGHAFMHELHLLREKGYAVLAVNPRGSEGYGEDFRDIRGKWGEVDFQDLMRAVDEAVKRGLADENRLYVMGGSYGGFMTNWIVGHTDRFKAAVTMRSISNFISDFGTTDIGYFFNPEQIGGYPWDNFQEYWRRSPLAYVANVKTPLLIIHSLNDFRCWYDQALELFTALKVLGREVEMVLFPEEDHDLSRKGKPKHRVERLKRILNWLEQHP